MKIRQQVLYLGVAFAVLSTAWVFFDAARAWSRDEAAEKGNFAHRHGMHRRFGAEAPLISIALRHRTELDLTADQVATLEEIRARHRDQTTPTREQLRTIEAQIRSLLHESPANLLEIRQKIEEGEKLRAELRYLRIEALENGRSVLTQHQRDQLRGFIASRRGFHRPQG